ncbi:hypothetical protein EPUS_06715 [Endocarpon pusillum Z07020]|uniref:C2H2-type domain-containing protein n=1 Tax=Endocarpon pusillum (strain Z07020 / HMAS-L-300199) TaxID=1263415 RepID=U1HKY7_ENDPU|nr:uncharacterized protein EPUS_06715 [Endocarpon pusillum Z07020]ERF70930.1 hypothetical protein EPUS_06715 [Endocarpon pusillum Z07020]
MEPTLRGDSSVSSDYLLTWIARGEHRQPKTNPDHSESPNLGFASNFLEACQQLLANIWTCCRLDRTRTVLQQRRIRDNLSRLVLWSDSLDHGQLDVCVERSAEVHDCVLEILLKIGTALVKGVYTIEAVRSALPNEDITAPLRTVSEHLDKAKSILDIPDEEIETSDTDSGSLEIDSSIARTELKFHKDLHNYMICLADLNPLLEETIEVDLSGRRQEDQAWAITFHVTDAAWYLVLQIHDKFRNAQTSLVERLGEANWQRFLRIRKHGRQQSLLQDEAEHQDGGRREEKVNEEDAKLLSNCAQRQEYAEPKSIFRSLSEFHDSGLGSSKPARSQAAASLASHSSFRSTLTENHQGRPRVPSMPPEVFSGKPFICFICGKKLTVIKNRIDWKMHVFLDLQPYICTFAGCRDMLVTFPTRALWFEHELQQHRVKESYKCNDCGQEVGSRDLFIRHLEVDHHMPLNNQQQATGWLSRRQFATHVACHMEEIALTSLPRNDEDDSDGSAVDEDDPTHSFPKSDNASSIQLERISDSPVADESDCTHPSSSKLNDASSVHVESARQSSSTDTKSEHWVTKVFLDTSTTLLTKTGAISRCYGEHTPEARTRLKEEFKEILEIAFGSGSELVARLYYREGDHRARILCKWPSSSNGGSKYSCLPLNVLEFHRAESSLQICTKKRGSSKLDLWANFVFSTIERLVVFYCTLLSLRGHDSCMPVTNIQDYELVGEAELFAGKIIDDNYLHALRVYRDRYSRAVRLQASVHKGEMKRVPIWTAFITQYLVFPTWLRLASPTLVYLRELRRHIFSSDYEPQVTNRGEHVFKFTSAGDAMAFVQTIEDLAELYSPLSQSVHSQPFPPEPLPLHSQHPPSPSPPPQHPQHSRTN